MMLRPMINSEKISTKDQHENWFVVGMLLYMVKHSCPNLINAIRKLSKANDGALCVIKYVLDTKNLGLMIKPTENPS